MTQMTVFVDKDIKKSYRAYIPYIQEERGKTEHVEINAWKI